MPPRRSRSTQPGPTQPDRDKLKRVVASAHAYKDLTEAANRLRAANLADLRSLDMTGAECRALGYLLLAAASLMDGEWEADPVPAKVLPL